MIEACPMFIGLCGEKLNLTVVGIEETTERRTGVEFVATYFGITVCRMMCLCNERGVMTWRVEK